MDKIQWGAFETLENIGILRTTMTTGEIRCLTPDEVKKINKVTNNALAELETVVNLLAKARNLYKEKNNER